MSLLNKKALITGVSGGIGKAIARKFAEEGADAVLNFHSRGEEAQELAMEIESGGRVAHRFKADVRVEEQVRSMVYETVKVLGGLDILVNNAGVLRKTPLTEMGVKDWDDVMDVNAKGPFLCSLYAGRYMIEHGGGTIVNVSSIAALNPEIYMGAYSVSKAALNMLTEVMAVEWARYNLRVNSVCPGPVDTPMIRQAFETPELLEARLDAIPMHRMSTPEDVAKVVTWLASDDSSMITGEHLVVDGGSARSMYYLVNKLGERS
jgi:glucose 1-dehydrogenase